MFIFAYLYFHKSITIIKIASYNIIFKFLAYCTMEIKSGLYFL